MKTCKSCFSEIDERAKKCPNCQSWQSKARTVFYNPAFSLIIFLIAMFGISSYFESKFTPKIAFTDYADQIAITESRIEFGENSCGETVAIIGKLKNESEIDWKDITYEVTFLDSDNNVSDTDQENEYSFILPANEEVPFKVSMKKEFDTEKYQNYKIRLVSARTKLYFFE
ncbi:MAG: hypothetical protein GY705_01815 [Bacteroidetes bacterium]|nr:hypothetical protein [Bacteroidota bacterium]